MRKSEKKFPRTRQSSDSPRTVLEQQTAPLIAETNARRMAAETDTRYWAARPSEERAVKKTRGTRPELTADIISPTSPVSLGCAIGLEPFEITSAECKSLTRREQSIRANEDAEDALDIPRIVNSRRSSASLRMRQRKRRSFGNGDK